MCDIFYVARKDIWSFAFYNNVFSVLLHYGLSISSHLKSPIIKGDYQQLRCLFQSYFWPMFRMVSELMYPMLWDTLNSLSLATGNNLFYRLDSNQRVAFLEGTDMTSLALYEDLWLYSPIVIFIQQIWKFSMVFGCRFSVATNDQCSAIAFLVAQTGVANLLPS